MTAVANSADRHHQSICQEPALSGTRHVSYEMCDPPYDKAHLNSFSVPFKPSAASTHSFIIAENLTHMHGVSDWE